LPTASVPLDRHGGIEVATGHLLFLTGWPGIPDILYLLEREAF
jgi:hypothetical protein